MEISCQNRSMKYRPTLLYYFVLFAEFCVHVPAALIFRLLSPCLSHWAFSNEKRIYGLEVNLNFQAARTRMYDARRTHFSDLYIIDLLRYTVLYHTYHIYCVLCLGSRDRQYNTKSRIIQSEICMFITRKNPNFQIIWGEVPGIPCDFWS